MTIHQADYVYDRREIHALFSIIQGNGAALPVRQKAVRVWMPTWISRMMAFWTQPTKSKHTSISKGAIPQGAMMSPPSRHVLQGWRAQTEPVNPDGFIAVLDQMSARHQAVPGFRRMRATLAEQTTRSE